MIRLLKHIRPIAIEVDQGPAKVEDNRIK